MSYRAETEGYEEVGSVKVMWYGSHENSSEAHDSINSTVYPLPHV